MDDMNGHIRYDAFHRKPDADDDNHHKGTRTSLDMTHAKRTFNSCPPVDDDDGLSWPVEWQACVHRRNIANKFRPQYT
jgi:hypothetical protein